MNIEIKPLDTLFFRDGKPFSMGEENWANGIFPPPPSVIAGAIKSSFLGQKDIPLSEAKEKTKGLKIRQLHIAHKGKVIFPIPNDLFQKKEGGKAYLFQTKQSPSISKYDYPIVLTSGTNEKIKELSGKAYLSYSAFKRYLKKSDDSFTIKEASDLVKSEPKIGIGLNPLTRLTKEGQLYRVGMNRPTELSFVVDFEDMELAQNGFLKLGAEGKSASYKVEELDVAVPAPSVTESTELVKLYLATPATFKHGWLPEWIKNNCLQTDEGEVNVELQCCAIGKPIHIGGFEMIDDKNGGRRYPKPMLKAVPAGSVYYLKASNPTALINHFHGKSIDEYRPYEGFGLAFFGIA